MTPLTSRRQPAAVRREQILDAAEAVMLRDGLHRATIADIAETAALGKGTVYLQFDSKEELVAGMRLRYIERIETEVRAKIGEGMSTMEKLSASVRAFVAASTRDPQLHHLLFQEAGVDEAAAFAPLRTLFAGILSEADLHAADRDLAIDFVLGGIHAGAIAVAHMPKNRRGRAISQIVDMVTRSLGAEA